jgi:GNAT superfamily N-acetyltransferase
MTRISADQTASTPAPQLLASGSATCRALTEADRPAIVDLFLALDHSSRYQRFGRIMTDATIANYGTQLNFTSSRMIGRFDGASLVGIAEVSLNDASCTPCEVVLTVVQSWQRRGVATALLHAAIASVHALKYSRLLVSFQGSDHRMRDLVDSLRTAPQCRAGEEELTFRVVVATGSAPLPIVVAHGGDVSVAIEWNRPAVPRQQACPA